MQGVPSTYYRLALNLALRELPPGDVADTVQAAIDEPGPDAIRAVLVAGRGTLWVQRVEHALIEVGVAASRGIKCR